MAACVTKWRGMAGFSNSASHADHRNSKARSCSVMRPREWIAKYSCIPDVSKLTQAPMGTIKKCGHSVGFWPVRVTSAGSEPNESEEPIDETPDKKEKKLNIDLSLEMNISFDESSSGPNDLTDEEPDDFPDRFQAQADKTNEALLEYWSRINELQDEVERKRIDQALEIDNSINESSFGANDSTDEETVHNIQAQADKVNKQADKVDGHRRGFWPVYVTSAGAGQIESEEPSDTIQNTQVPDSRKKKLIDQALGTKSYVYKSSLTAQDPTDEETSESVMLEDALNLLPGLDCSDEALTKVVTSAISPESSSFRRLSPTSRVVIEVMNKLVALLLENLELAIAKFMKCPIQDLIVAITLILLLAIGQYLSNIISYFSSHSNFH